MMSKEELFYTIALTKVHQMGPVQCRLLMEKLGSAKIVFESTKKTLESIEGIGTLKAKAIKSFTEFNSAEQEIKFIEKYQISALTILDEAYPQKLLHCYDPPTILYKKGTANLNAKKIIAVIGTRHHTDYGKQVTDSFVKSLATHNITILSGMAFGIDAIAHRAALIHQTPTIGVLAHGQDTIYPKEHRPLANQILQESGALITEYGSNTLPDRHHFPQRNRIVAGMADAVLVIESGLKGGSMVTADLASGYHKDVFAIPGRIQDPRSAGCIQLIKQNKAQIITAPEDIISSLGWEKKPFQTVIQKEFFIQLSPDEKILVDLLNDTPIHIDLLSTKSKLPHSKVAAALLSLELQGIVKSMPGPSYSLT